MKITRNDCLFIVQILLTLINTVQCVETATKPPKSASKFRTNMNKNKEKGRNFHENDDQKYCESSSKHPSSLIRQHKHKTMSMSPQVFSHRRQVQINSPCAATNSPRAKTTTNSESELRQQQRHRFDSVSLIPLSATPKKGSNYLYDNAPDDDAPADDVPADAVVPTNGFLFFFADQILCFRIVFSEKK